MSHHPSPSLPPAPLDYARPRPIDWHRLRLDILAGILGYCGTAFLARRIWLLAILWHPLSSLPLILWLAFMFLLPLLIMLLAARHARSFAMGLSAFVTFALLGLLACVLLIHW